MNDGQRVLAQEISFMAPLPPPPLRRNHETANRGYRKLLLNDYTEAVWCAAYDETRSQLLRNVYRWNYDVPWPKATLTLEWRHHRVGPDEDNALASLKPLIDTLTTRGRRPLGLVVDDSPAHLSVSISVVKVREKRQEGVLVTLRKVEP